MAPAAIAEVFLSGIPALALHTILLGVPWQWHGTVGKNPLECQDTVFLAEHSIYFQDKFLEYLSTSQYFASDISVSTIFTHNPSTRYLNVRVYSPLTLLEASRTRNVPSGVFLIMPLTSSLHTNGAITTRV